MTGSKVLLILGAAILVAGCASSPSDSRRSPTPASTAKAELYTVSETLAPVHYEAVGSIRAQFNATLSSKVMARVVSVSAREGDEVRRGQSLVALDTRELAAGVRIAEANYGASVTGVSRARTASEMEARTADAKIAQSEAAVVQSRAAVNAAKSRLELVLAGPRAQEKVQARLAVTQAESALRLARTELDRVTRLVEAGALPRKSLDQAQTTYEVALAQRDSAVQAERVAQEGSRVEEIRTAQEGVAQAEAALKQAEANLRFARAAALQTRVREEEIKSAQAQVKQSTAALQSARVSLAYRTVTAPFDGRIVMRSVDPGAMALPGSPLMELEGGPLRLEAPVPESVLTHVALKAPIRVHIDALDRELTGVVDEIVPQGDRASHTFLVKLRLPKTEGVRSAMFGRALIETKREPTLQIPLGATWEREGLHYVYVVNPEGIARLRIVTLGKPLDGHVAVLSGLNAGERIVVGGREHVKDGTKVTAR